MKTLGFAVLLLLCGLAHPSATQSAWGRDELVTSARTPGGETVPYVLTTKNGTPAYAVILMPGGSGVMNPRMVNGRLVFGFGGNFLIRSRELFADGRSVAASTDATSTPARILAIAQDLERRFGKAAIYVIDTSRSTEATMLLAATTARLSPTTATTASRPRPSTGSRRGSRPACNAHDLARRSDRRKEKGGLPAAFSRSDEVA